MRYLNHCTGGKVSTEQVVFSLFALSSSRLSGRDGAETVAEPNPKLCIPKPCCPSKANCRRKVVALRVMGFWLFDLYLREGAAASAASSPRLGHSAIYLLQVGDAGLASLLLFP